MRRSISIHILVLTASIIAALLVFADDSITTPGQTTESGPAPVNQTVFNMNPIPILVKPSQYPHGSLALDQKSLESDQLKASLSGPHAFKPLAPKVVIPALGEDMSDPEKIKEGSSTLYVDLQKNVISFRAQLDYSNFSGGEIDQSTPQALHDLYDLIKTDRVWLVADYSECLTSIQYSSQFKNLDPSQPFVTKHSTLIRCDKSEVSLQDPSTGKVLPLRLLSSLITSSTNQSDEQPANANKRIASFFSINATQFQIISGNGVRTQKVRFNITVGQRDLHDLVTDPSLVEGKNEITAQDQEYKPDRSIILSLVSE